MKYLSIYLPILTIFTFTLYTMDKDWFSFVILNGLCYELTTHVTSIIESMRKTLNDRLQLLELFIRMNY